MQSWGIIEIDGGKGGKRASLKAKQNKKMSNREETLQGGGVNSEDEDLIPINPRRGNQRKSILTVYSGILYQHADPHNQKPSKELRRWWSLGSLISG